MFIMHRQKVGRILESYTVSSSGWLLPVPELVMSYMSKLTLVYFITILGLCPKNNENLLGRIYLPCSGLMNESPTTNPSVGRTTGA